MFLWAGVVLYVATAWRVRVEGRLDPGELGLDGTSPPILKGPHVSLARMVHGEWNSTPLET